MSILHEMIGLEDKIQSPAISTPIKMTAIITFFFTARSSSVFGLAVKRLCDVKMIAQEKTDGKRHQRDEDLFTKFRLYGAAKRGTLRTMSGGAAAEATERKGRIKR